MVQAKVNWGSIYIEDIPKSARKYGFCPYDPSLLQVLLMIKSCFTQEGPSLFQPLWFIYFCE